MKKRAYRDFRERFRKKLAMALRFQLLPGGFFHVALHFPEVAEVSLRANDRRRQIVDDVQDLEVCAKGARELATVIECGV